MRGDDAPAHGAPRMLGVAATTHSAAPILGAAQAPAGTADPTRVAALLRQLREHQQENERIRRALERVSEELREVREGSHRLFETLCQSLLGTALGDASRCSSGSAGAGTASSSTPWIVVPTATSP